MKKHTRIVKKKQRGRANCISFFIFFSSSWFIIGQLGFNKNSKTNKVVFFLGSKSSGKVTHSQMESVKKTCFQRLKNLGLKNPKQHYLCFLNFFKNKTKKNIGSRMGKGKGEIAGWFCPVSAGQQLLSFKKISIFVVRKVVPELQSKLPIKLFIGQIF
jgi:ribosomal protein L16/L10AE